MRYQRFVALGDSCTEGLDDRYPGGTTYRGWADLVAASLAAGEPGFRYANLGVRGRRLDQILVEQVPTAEELRPDLVALFGGGNDVLARGFDASVVADRVEAAVRAVSRFAPTLVLFTLSDLSGRVPIVRGLRGRLEALNAAIHASARRHGALVVDLWPDPAAHDLRYFGPDRFHLGEPGHRRLAAHLLSRLGLPYEESWLRPLPGAPRPATLRAHAEWIWREVRPVAITRMRNRIIGRSPGDGFVPKRPELLPFGAADLTPEPTGAVAGGG